MDIMLWVLFCLTTFLILWTLKKIFIPDRLCHLPGPKGLPLIGSILDIERDKLRISLHRYAKQYGGVYRVRLAIGDVVVLSSYDYIHRGYSLEMDMYSPEGNCSSEANS